MKNKDIKTKHPKNLEAMDEVEKVPDSFSYPAADDIYSQSKEETGMDPEDITRTKTPNEKRGDIDPSELDFDEDIPGRDMNKDLEGDDMNEMDFDDDVSGRDLDVPGSDLDDALEDNGDEDEENNSYSLGGDRHEDLEEDKGE